MRSLERHLLAWVMGALSIGAVGLTLVSYLVTLDEMDEVSNQNLKQVALSVAAYHHAGASAGGQATVVSSATADPNDTVDPTDLVAMTWTLEGERTFSSDPGASVPFTRQPGASIAGSGEGAWYVYSIVKSDGVVQAAQRVTARREMAVESATKMFPPLAGFFVLIGGLLVFALRRGLRPLDFAAVHVAARTAASLDPIGVVNMPREIHPLVEAVNEMMRRLSIAFEAQRRFVADAAHELRTPMTALRLQCQLLQRAKDEVSRHAALVDLEAGIDRSDHLVAQLLRLSRVEPTDAVQRVERVDLGELVRSVVATMSVKAEHKGIDLGADGGSAMTVAADREQLVVMLNNLVGNALRYTQKGGVVDVVAEEFEGRPSLRVTDDGPGIPECERGRVFDRFYRGAGVQSEAGSVGTGLGLAIVQAVARCHEATVELSTAPSGRGLDVRIVFWRSSDAPPPPMESLRTDRTGAYSTRSES